jgi:hypothetical protein
VHGEAEPEVAGASRKLERRRSVVCSYTGVGQDVQGTLAGGLRRSLRTPVRRGAVTAAGRVGSKGEVAGAGARNRRSTVSIGRPQPARSV